MTEKTATIKERAKTLDTPKELQEFLEAGVHFGHQKSEVHPGMFPFIFGVRNNVHIIDVARTKERLDTVLDFIKTLNAEGRTILFVGTKFPIREVTRKTAEATGMPHVTEYWAGGTLTNWKNIQERIEHLKDLESKKKSDEWQKYTKHERLQMEREMAKLEKKLGGIKDMTKRPDAMFVVDAAEDVLAITEARQLGIPIMAIVDTNINPASVDYPIPANDDAISSVKLILKKVEEALIKSKGSAPAKNEINEIMDKKTAKDSNLKPLAPASHGRDPDRSVMTKI